SAAARSARPGSAVLTADAARQRSAPPLLVDAHADDVWPAAGQGAAEMIPESEDPPRVWRALLSTLLHPDDRECALADLHEEFETRVARDGERAARHWYRAQVRMSIVP